MRRPPQRRQREVRRRSPNGTEASLARSLFAGLARWARRVWSCLTHILAAPGWKGRAVLALLLLGLWLASVQLDRCATGSDSQYAASREVLEFRDGEPARSAPMLFPTGFRKARQFTIELDALATDDHFVNFF